MTTYGRSQHSSGDTERRGDYSADRAVTGGVPDNRSGVCRLAAADAVAGDDVTAPDRGGLRRNAALVAVGGRAGVRRNGRGSSVQVFEPRGQAAQSDAA